MSDQQAVKIRTALISVSNKTGLVEFCRSLVEEFGIKIISTGGTLKALKEAKVNAIEISEFTNFPEMMDGRVKTLHPKYMVEYWHAEIRIKRSWKKIISHP